ncbi:MAG TPA: prolyl oligopeptidase family serine peptidase [Pyrinomonadaceae bacterium]|nr:prolyl oligopeptidase family serine peptidase [Pyrinomonadaceae bacterium]
MKIFVKAALSLFFLLFVQCVSAQSISEEFLRREVKINSNAYGYRVYVPKNRNPKKKLPVMLFLHGNGVNGADNERHIQGISETVNRNPEFFNFIIVFPQARQNTFWVGEMVTQAVKALDQTVEEFNGDSKKLYLAGFSMGGYGTWATAVLNPHKFAALLPIAGGIVPPYQLPSFVKQTLPPPILAILDAPSPHEALAEKIGQTPVWLFHGDEDESVPVTESRKISAALKKNGNKNVIYTEFEKTNHNNALIKAFSEPKLFQWLAKQKLKKVN